MPSRRPRTATRRAETFAIVGTRTPEAGLAQPHRLFQHRVEHRGEIAGRGIDDPQHLGGRGLLVERLRQFGGAVVDLLFEFGVGCLQVGRHAVELLARPSSSSPVWMSMRRSSSPAPIRAAPSCNGPDRPGHAAGETSAAKVAAMRPSTSSAACARQRRRAARRPRSAAARQTRASRAARSRHARSAPRCPATVVRRSTDHPPLAPGWARASARAAATCGRFDRSVSRNTRLISG